MGFCLHGLSYALFIMGETLPIRNNRVSNSHLLTPLSHLLEETLNSKKQYPNPKQLHSHLAVSYDVTILLHQLLRKHPILL